MEEITATYTQPFQNYPDVVSTLQLCEMLGVSERTVYRLLVTNQIKHFKVGRAYRIPKANVFAFMESESRGFVTAHFSAVLKANNLPHIRFHDLRHPYVKPTTKKFITFLKFFGQLHSCP